MKNGILSAVLIAFLLSIAGFAGAQEDEKIAPSCPYCGMNRAKFAHSRMLVTYDDGTKVGTCSLHCLAIDLAINIDKTPQLIEVGDVISKNLMDAEKAYWVIGGTKTGVMTEPAKWAFANKVYADKFIRERGGTLATFEEAMKAAYQDMYADTKMLREKRKMKKPQEAEKQ
jgi:nitrous oxide reductase accessory protein NosL